jgi:threonine aldolase
LLLDDLKNASQFCKIHGLINHLDGARVFNAAVKLNVELHTISQYFDSISICLSKGLGAPVGSVLCGTKDLIKKARRWRKVLGGGMRQTGIIAAAGIYALDHNVTRLKTDHENAALLAEGLSEIDAIKVDKNALQTNILFIKAPEDYTELQAYLYQQGIHFPKQANKMNLIRLVTHLDVSSDDIRHVINNVKNYYSSNRR